MSEIRTGYTQTKVSAPVAPSETSVLDMDMAANLIREIWQERIIDEPQMKWNITSARSFFNGESMIDIRTLMDYLRFGQQIVVPIKKDQNPFDLYQSETLSYNALDNCHDQLDLDCSLPCISTNPTFDTLVFRFDTEYAYGVRACVTTEDFYPFEWYMDQYGLSRAAKDFGREVDLWNKVIKGLVAAPATTVDVTLAPEHPTQYWSGLGAFSGMDSINQIRKAYWYAQNSYQIEPTTFITPEMANAIINTVQTQWNLNANWQMVNTYVNWDVPGFMIDEQVRQILGTVRYVVIMQRSPWMTWNVTSGTTTTTVSNYPLWSSDLTKEYVAILDPRVGYQFAKAGKQLTIRPYDCDKMYKGMVDTEYVGSGITFPQYGMILEFNRIGAPTPTPTPTPTE